MADDDPYTGDTPTGTDPDARYEEPGYQDVSLGQAVDRDRELAERLVDESADLDEASRRFDDEATGAPSLGRAPGDGELGASDAAHLLAIYLGDHRAGAAAGVELARRARDQNSSSDFAGELGAIYRELMADRDTLERVAGRLGAGPARLKATLGTVGAKIGTLKPSGRLRRYSPVSRVLEIEGLIAGVTAKRQLCDVLRFAGGSASGIATDVDSLAERAESQLEVLRRVHREAALLAFGEVGAPTRRTS